MRHASGGCPHFRVSIVLIENRGFNQRKPQNLHLLLRSCASKVVVSMAGTIVAEIAAGILLVSVWYLWFFRTNRRRSRVLIEQIRSALGGHAQIVGIHWISPSRFHVRLRLFPEIFRHCSVAVQLVPRELPLSWFLSAIRNQRETLTFEADLDVPPGFSLEVHNQRWSGRSGRKRRRQPNLDRVETCGPFVLTTRTDWQREITAMMNALVASRDSDFLTVSFRRTSPHFAASVPVSSLSEEHTAHMAGTKCSTFCANWRTAPRHLDSRQLASGPSPHLTPNCDLRHTPLQHATRTINRVLGMVP